MTDVYEAKREFVEHHLAETVIAASRGIVREMWYERHPNGNEFVYAAIRGMERPVRINVHMDSEWAIIKDTMKGLIPYVE